MARMQHRRSQAFAERISDDSSWKPVELSSQKFASLSQRSPDSANVFHSVGSSLTPNQYSGLSVGRPRARWTGAITIRRHVNLRPAERLTRTPGHAMHFAATLSRTIHPTTPVDTTAPMPTQSCQMRHEMRVGETTIRRQDDVP